MSKEDLPPSRTAEQFVVRFPDGMRYRIAEAAKASGRSMNAEIIARIQSTFKPEQKSFDFEVLPQVIDNLQRKLMSQREAIESLERHGAEVSKDSDGSVRTIKMTVSKKARPKTPWFKRGFGYSVLHVEESGRHTEVAKLTIVGGVPQAGDEKLIYDEITAVERLHGSDSTVWLDIEGDAIPKSVQTAIEHLVAYGVGLVVTIQDYSTLSNPDKFPSELMTAIKHAMRSGLVWCPLAKKLMHAPHGLA